LKTALESFYQNDTQAKEAHMPSDKERIWQKTKSDNLRRWHMLQPSLRNGDHILEIGSGYGSFLRAVQENKGDLNIQVTGHEISEPRRKVASAYAKVFSDLELRDLPHNVIFSHIVCYHVLEHVLDLEGFIENIRKFCKVNTKLIIEVPNVNDDMLRRCSAYSQFYWQSAHLTYWSVRTLELFLSRLGTQHIKISGVQRYGMDNHDHWLKTGKPQYACLASSGSITSKDRIYRQKLIDNLTCDTLYVECNLVAN